MSHGQLFRRRIIGRAFAIPFVLSSLYKPRSQKCLHSLDRHRYSPSSLLRSFSPLLQTLMGGSHSSLSIFSLLPKLSAASLRANSLCLLWLVRHLAFSSTCARFFPECCPMDKGTIAEFCRRYPLSLTGLTVSRHPRYSVTRYLESRWLCSNPSLNLQLQRKSIVFSPNSKVHARACP